MKMKGDVKYIVYGVVVVLIIAAGLLGYNKFASGVNNPQAQQQVTEEETAEMIKAISKIMLVPTDDKPVMVKVDNAETLQNQQAFFKGVQNGDVVLIFPKTARAIIYSPARNIVVNSGPVQSQPAQGQAPVPTTPTEAPAAEKTPKK